MVLGYNEKRPTGMDYERLLIEEYTHWEVYLNENQCYLGKCYIWAKRENVIDFFDMTDDEKEEYFEIGIKLKLALGKIFRPDLYNYATLANVSPHLHTHVIPRYSSPREFKGIVFTDKRWGQNYAPYDKEFKISEEILMQIKDSIKKALKSTF